MIACGWRGEKRISNAGLVMTKISKIFLTPCADDVCRWFPRVTIGCDPKSQMRLLHCGISIRPMSEMVESRMGCGLCGQDPEGGEAGRPAGRAANQARDGRQPQNGQGARARNTARNDPGRRRVARMKHQEFKHVILLRCMSQLLAGTFRKRRPCRMTSVDQGRPEVATDPQTDAIDPFRSAPGSWQRIGGASPPRGRSSQPPRPRVMHEFSAREGSREAFTGETTGQV
jgi:hypothetical protein